MNSSSTNDFKKQAPPIPMYNQPASGIPIGSEGYYVGVNQQQIPLNYQAQAGSITPWSTGLCGCCDDVPNCCITCWCPCITFGQIAEIVDKGATTCATSGALYALIAMVTGCACFYSCFYRSKIRQQFMLHESPCTDCLVHCCCESCALCQEYRELKNRGYDMTIGWQGNAERQHHGVAMAPVVQGGMTR